MSKRFEVLTVERHGLFRFSLVDRETGATVFDEGQDLAFYFDAAAMLNQGLALDEVRELMAVRPYAKKCGC